MTGKDMLFQLWDYNRWANTRLVEKASELSPEVLLQDSPELHRGSLMNTLIHMYENERAWRKMVLEGEKPPPVVDANDPPELSVLTGWWDAESREMQAFLNELSDQLLGSTITVRDHEGSEYPMVVWQMLMQAFLNSLQHRAEAAAYLTSLGHSPGELDFVFFV
jgi:uncharacterized damage-inducible protein DinB